jgi:hypothetical protein
MVMPALVAVAGDGHVALLVITTVTMSASASAEVVNVALFVPAFTPSICHWYDGVEPPFVGVAVKVTLVPAQIVVADADTDTDGVTLEFTVIVTPALVAVVVERQLALLVI